MTIESVSTGVITMETGQETGYGNSTTFGTLTFQSASTGTVTMETSQQQADILIEASTIYISGASAEVTTVYVV